MNDQDLPQEALDVFDESKDLHTALKELLEHHINELKEDSSAEN